MKNRKIISGCFAVSLFFHIFSIAIFQRYSLWFSSPQKIEDQAGWLSLVDKKEKDQILKVAFSPIKKGGKEKVSSPQKEVAESFHFRSFIPLPEHEISMIFTLPMHDFLASQTVLPTFTIPLEPFNLLDHLPKDLIVPLPAKGPKFSPTRANDPVVLSSEMPKIGEKVPETPISHSGEMNVPLTDAPYVGKAPGMIQLPHLPRLPTLDELETSSYSDSFDTDLIFLPKEDGGGYIFALTLIPKPDLELPRIRQHFTFLIDRSNSIQQGRLTATKSAIHKALEELNPEDTFNIIAFDGRMEKMSPHPLPCVGKSYAMAEGFLEKIQLGSFFSSSDLYKPLLLTVPAEVKNDEIYTAILLTDGETLAKKTAQRAVLYEWTQYNKGKVALYAIGMNNDAHTATLDAAAIFNKGKFSYASTNRGVKRKLLKLLKTIQTPVAKNLSCNAISRAPETKIRLFPSSSQMPHLYLDQPYVILGETNTLDDFILFVQGRLKDRWLNVKKTVSFLSAKKGGKSLRQEWALQCAYNLYEHYVIDDDPKHIAEAALLLEPFDYQVAFQ